MNHRYYSVNVSNSNMEKKETAPSQSNILEKELKEMYNTQYNDLFPKILTKTKSEFIPLLKSQVSLHLKIINKTVQTSLNTKYLEFFTKKFFTDKSKTTKGFEDILKNTDLQKNNLELVNCYIHCHKCSKILHECKNKLILYKSYIYCIHCQKVYNENQMKLYCDECKTCYYSKMRFVLNKKYENFYQVYFKEYHCNLEEPEKIKCLECGHDLYYNITYDKKNLKKNAISEIFCLKCKLLYDLNEVFFKCKICKKNFKSEAKIFNNFSNLKLQFLLIMHTLRKKKMALPEKRISRKCKCDITKYEKYLHEEDNGILYLGHNLKGDYIILCDNCYTIFNYNDFIWTCPVCNINFKSKKNLYKKKYIQTTNYFGEKISSKIEKSPTMYKSPSNINFIHRRKLLETGPSSAGDKENIVKNLFNKNNNNNNINNNQLQTEKKTTRNSNKFNHITKVIMLTTNKKNKINTNLNLSNEKSQKMHFFKKIKNINLMNNTNYHTTINEPKKEIEIKKTNLKSFIKNKNYTNTNTINSVLNSISYTNNKSDCNTNKCNDSTNITSPNYENINEINNNNENDKGLKYIIEHDSNSKKNNNNKVNRKLFYNDLIETDKKPETVIDKKQIKKNIEPLNDKFINEQLKNINEINNKDTKDFKEKNLCKTSKKEKHFIRYIIEKKENRNNENPVIKKVNTSLLNKLNNENNILLDSIDKSYIKKNDKKNLNKTNEIIDKKENNKDKDKDNLIKNIKSMRNIRINNNNLNIKNLKTSNYIIRPNNYPEKSSRQPLKTAQNSQNKIRLIKNIRSLRDRVKLNNNLESNNKTNNNENNSKINSKENNNIINNKENNNNKQLIIKEKKQITRCSTQFKLQSKKSNNSKNNYNSIFKKLKEYYDEGINEESIDSNNQKKSKKSKNINLNKSIALASKKKIKYKPFFKSENYSILKLLGKGTYGKTYLVEDPKTKERFALKKITINDKSELKENQEEYNLILKLTKEFPELKIVNIYGIEIKTLDKYTTVMYVLMEAAKCDWEKEITSHSEVGYYYKEEHLMNILYNLVKSFAILQKKGICHRDVKPQNILCFQDNEYKISDFGEAKNFKKNMINGNKRYSNMKYNVEENTMEQTLRGTELYMSPILFKALRTRSYQFVTYNPYKSDVFSLGMCFFLASSLSYEGLYEVREIIRNKDKTRLVVNRYLSMKYSQKYINVLISMLQINEKDRPDFFELEKILDNLNK